MSDRWRPERHYRRNLLAVAGWETPWGFGMGCVSSSIVMAFFVQLTESKTLIGSLSLTNLVALPLLFVTLYVNRRLRQKRRFATALWSAQTLCWVALGAGTLASGPTSRGWLVVLLFVAYALIQATNSLSTAPTYEMLASVFARRWGTAQGIQILCNRTTGVVGGVVAAAILDRYGFPMGFGLTFLLGGTVLTLSNLALLGFVEPPAYGGKAPPPFPVYLRTLADSVAGHREFLTFLPVLGLLALIAMAQGFYVVYALEALQLPPSVAGVFTSVAFAANALSGLIAGPIGDRFGHRWLLLGSLGLHLAAMLLVLNLGDLWQFYGVLALSGAATVGASIATTNITADFAPPGEKGGYTAISRMVTQPATALSALLGGILIDALGFAPVFALSLLFPLAAVVTTLRFRDPRLAERAA